MRLRTTRTALGLYGALLVMPTLVFGWLYWRELVEEHQAQLAAVPDDARDAARRIVDGMRERLERLIEEETQRPFTQYARQYSPQEAVGDEINPAYSPLVNHPRPEGVEGWFSYALHEKSSAGTRPVKSVIPSAVRSARVASDTATSVDLVTPATKPPKISPRAIVSRHPP